MNELKTKHTHTPQNKRNKSVLPFSCGIINGLLLLLVFLFFRTGIGHIGRANSWIGSITQGKVSMNF